MSRTPYSPLVLNETAPLPWNAGREPWAGPATGSASGVTAAPGVETDAVRGGSSIPSVSVGIMPPNLPVRQRGAPVIGGAHRIAGSVAPVGVASSARSRKADP